MIGRVFWLGIALSATVWRSEACIPPTIDGHVTKQNCEGLPCDPPTSPLSATLSTGANEVIFVHIETDILGSGPPPAIASINDTAVLPWVVRGTRQTWAGNGQTYASDDYWAYSAGALVSDVITVTWSAQPVRNIITATGISGVTTPTAPFDTNAGFPAYNQDETGNSIRPTVAISTDHAADMIFITCGSSSPVNFCSSTTTPPWGKVNFDGGSGPLCCAMVDTDYERTSLPKLTAYTAEPGTTTARYWQLTANAFVGDDTGCAARPWIWIEQ